MAEPPKLQDGPAETVLSPVQQAIALKLRNYYQMQCVTPTPHRLQMLLDELCRRAEAHSRRQ